MGRRNRTSLKMGKIGYVDDSFGDTLKNIKKKYKYVGIELNDRQASKIIADIFKEIDFNVYRKSKKRRKKFEIELV